MKTIMSIVPERANFVAGHEIVEIGYPWLTPGAIMALELLVNKELTVFECGAGGSTVFFAERCKSVIALESDSAWAEKVRERVALFNNTAIYVLPGTAEFLAFIATLPDANYDIVSVDSNPNVTNRLVMTNAVVSKLKVNGWMIVDNYGEWVRSFTYPGMKIYTFDDFSWAGQGTRLCQKLV